ncbi:MAG: alanine--tRNA ligase [Nitrospirae bacterium]|nr:alanine--tRNA ligase [Candidatus Troglogloeales bacterium]
MKETFSSEVRSLFIRYFRERDHAEVLSSPLVPEGDPSLLFTNAGMVQFKSTFLGEKKRSYVRAVSSQKCMRAGGKHNDLDQVGKTARHHTFFEMLGNFSFGNYFKKEAIEFAWELVTDGFNLPKDKIWITVYQDDDEAEMFWKRYLSKERILRLGAKDNFWQMGETGPCGPCSEIFIDQGEALHLNCPGIGLCDCDRYIEIWNLVFMQYNKSANGTTSLPNPSIDTGMGLERMTAICQGVASNYQTDLFKPIFSAIAREIGQSVNETIQLMPARVIADHLRAMTFLISDGVIPSNEGRGYVLRRIIRRAARFGRKLGIVALHTLTGEVIDTMRSPYTELEQHRNQIGQMVRMEEEQFEETLTRGGAFMEEIVETVKKKGEREIGGETVFKLYDTYGFPVDLTLEVAEEAGLSIDQSGFQVAMLAQQERARNARFAIAATPIAPNPSPALLKEMESMAAPTPFTGYEHLTEDVKLLHIFKGSDPVASASAGEQVELIFNQSPFYSEGGGQVGDSGLLVSEESQVAIEDTQKRKETFLHRARVIKGTVSVGGTYRAQVDKEARQNTARNHTATHILHAVLRETLGDHVKQAGSLVCPERLRFDFQHFTSMTQDEINKIEARVNERILENSSVGTEVMAVAEAISSGAMALFGEKYGASVRVVQVSDFSRELCGGTHCRYTGEIGLFKIVKEGSVASGIRRIEAVTGVFAYQEVKKLEATLREIAASLKTSLKEKDREIEKLKSKRGNASAFDPLLEVVHIGSVSLLVQKMPPSNVKDLRADADRLRDRLRSGIVIVGAGDEAGEKATVVVMVTPEWTALYPASGIAAKLAVFIGGTGGGKAEMAQAGGKGVDQLDAALAKSAEIIQLMKKP